VVNVEITRNPNLPYYPSYLFDNSILTFTWNCGDYALFESNNLNTITLPLDFNNTIKKTVYSYINSSITPSPGQVFNGVMRTSINEAGFFIDQSIEYVLHVFRSLYDLIPVLLLRIGDNDIVYMNRDVYSGALRLRNTEVTFKNTTSNPMVISYDLTYDRDLMQLTRVFKTGLLLTQTATGANLTFTLNPGDVINRFMELPFNVKFIYPDSYGYYRAFLKVNGDDIVVNPEGKMIRADVVPADLPLTNDLNKATFLPLNINNCEHVGIGLYYPTYVNIDKVIVRYMMPLWHSYGFKNGSELYLEDADSDVSPKLDLSTFKNPVVGNYIYGKQLTSSDATFNFISRMGSLPLMNRVFNNIVKEIQDINYLMDEGMLLVEDYDSTIYKVVNFSAAVNKRYDHGLVTSLSFNNPNSLSYTFNNDFNDDYWYKSQYPSDKLYFYIDGPASPNVKITFKAIGEPDWTDKHIILKNLDSESDYVYDNNKKLIYKVGPDDGQVHVMEPVDGLIDYKNTDTVIMSNYSHYIVSFESEDSLRVNMNCDEAL
jgi:hypothetical protein